MDCLLIDNFDSFTYNLVQLVGSLGHRIEVRRNTVSVAEVRGLGPDCLMVSPGPGSPADSGGSRDILREFSGRKPILGVCLGMQCINEVFGGVTRRAPVPMHGKTSLVRHPGAGLFAGVRNPLRVARYHSLFAGDVPPVLEVLAEVDAVPMALRHREHLTFGVQFHPESFMTEDGAKLMSNFFRIAEHGH